ncbi:MAG: MFS transporter, partial [Acidimicrobiia bacterium]|nr:MFS transporter [Acidimicrobiia bacterium]
MRALDDGVDEHRDERDGKQKTRDVELFGVFSTRAAFTDTTQQLIIGRGLMGIGGALVFPSTLAILIDVFRDPVERAKSIGVWSAVSGAAVAFGPVVGGFLLEHFWW